MLHLGGEGYNNWLWWVGSMVCHCLCEMSGMKFLYQNEYHSTAMAY